MVLQALIIQTRKKMKKKFIYFTAALGLVIGAVSCEKESNDITPTRNIPNMSYVQWYNATVNSTRNFIYVNGIPANGNAVAYGASFPTSSYAFALYSGSNGIAIRDTLSTTTQVQQQFVHNFEAGKNYSIFTYDTITAPKRIVVENNFEIPADSSARLRFANLIYNPTAIPNIDVFSFQHNANIFTNVPAGSVTNFVPFNSAVTDTLYFRNTGTLTNLLKVPINLNRKRSYTVIYRGSYRSTTKTTTVIANN